MPMSLQSSTVSMLLMPKTPVCGPIMNPAMMYPSIVGCFSALQMIVKIPADMSITARSRTKFTPSVMILRLNFPKLAKIIVFLEV